MKFKRELKLERGTLDITPLIDVVFLLLIFFMLTSSSLMQPGIKVRLPRVQIGAPVEVQKLEITIDQGLPHRRP